MTGTSLAARVSVSAGCRGGGRCEAGWKWSPDSGLLASRRRSDRLGLSPAQLCPRCTHPLGDRPGAGLGAPFHRPRRGSVLPAQAGSAYFTCGELSVLCKGCPGYLPAVTVT